MSIIIDLIIISIVLLSVFFAYKKGLVSLALGLASFAIALVVTVILYKPISNVVINTTGIDEMIENTIYEKANEAMKKKDNKTSELITNTTQNNLLPQTAKLLAVNIVTGGVILILTVGIRIALRFVNSLANVITKLPIINQVDKMGGVIYGLLRGLLIVYIVLLLVSVVGKINPENGLYQNIENSSLGKTMYENNVLNIFFEKN